MAIFLIDLRLKIINTKLKIMKKSLLSIALIFALGLSFTSCRDTKKADSVEVTIENAAEETAEATEGALERTGKALDNVVEETKEAGEAVENAAKEIDGDGN